MSSRTKKDSTNKRHNILSSPSDYPTNATDSLNKFIDNTRDVYVDEGLRRYDKARYTRYIWNQIHKDSLRQPFTVFYNDTQPYECFILRNYPEIFEDRGYIIKTVRSCYLDLVTVSWLHALDIHDSDTGNDK